jgi:hypothetical protein
MKAARSKRRPDFTLEVDRIIECIDPPGGRPLHTRRTGIRKLRNGQQLVAKRDRLRPLVSMIGNCMTLARHIDAKGLDDVVELLHKAYSKTVNHQFGRR